MAEFLRSRAGLRAGILTSLWFVIAMPVAQAQPAREAVPTISVSATGQSSVAPDMANLTMAVLSEAKTARAALDDNTKQMRAVIDAMKASGIAERDLQTSGFSINPRYSYPNRQSGENTPKLIGYSINNTLTVRVRALDKLGTLLDKAVTLGINQGGNIEFANSEPDAVISLARASAMKQAIAKAQTLVKAAGVALGRITAISEHANRPIARPMASARAMSVESAPVPVQAGENNYAVTVNVSWEIKQ